MESLRHFMVHSSLFSHEKNNFYLLSIPAFDKSLEVENSLLTLGFEFKRFLAALT